MRFLIIFIFFISSALADDNSIDIKNIVIYEKPKTYNNLSFLDYNRQKVSIDDFKGKLVMLNFWATWCAPCKEEMPSLDLLQTNPKLDNLEIIPINVGQDSFEKIQNFFNELDIKNLQVYFDNPETLAKKFALRGLPTTIVLNKNGKELARIIGSIDFNEKKFVDWLTVYN